MTTEATPGALGSNDQLGLVPERESVDDALMIVESYGPWGADLNGAHRRQIVLSDEVLRLRGLYEMAVRGRAEMRAALRQERRAEELHEGCRMPMEQARALSASEAAPDWYARGQDWGLADALTAGQNGDWTLDDIARAFAAGAQAGTSLEGKRTHEIECRRVALEEQADLTAIHVARMQSALEQTARRSADYLRKAIKAEAKCEVLELNLESARAELAKVNNEFGSENADWPEAWRRVAEVKERAGRLWRDNEALRAALTVVVNDWTEQFERNGHLAPGWVKQAREALGPNVCYGAEPRPNLPTAG